MFFLLGMKGKSTVQECKVYAGIVTESAQVESRNKSGAQHAALIKAQGKVTKQILEGQTLKFQCGDPGEISE